ncbi:DNA repair protein RAD51 [Pleodorina starrii]|nr:DNA repair protein RAD51 [Pleodorina starrii]
MTTARDVLLLGPLDLMELLGLTWSQAAQLLADVSAQITPPYTTAWEALAQLTAAEGPPPLRTGLPTLDGALRLGLPAGSITELVGPGGVGKSQMCHMMALAAALPAEQGGLAAGVVYIDTERKFSAARLAEMVRARAAAAAAAGNRAGGAAPHGGNGDAGGGGGGGGALVSEVLQRVVVMTPGRTEELVGALESLQTIVLRHKARLVVIDSIAALARTEYGNVPGGGGDGSGAGGGLGGGGGGGLVGSILERQQVLGRIASQLKALAESLRVPVLVTNQVTTRITPAAGGQQPPGGGGGGGGGGTLTAALGTKWAHCVNLRLVLERLHERRFLKVAKSPSCANVVLEYVIGPTGLQQVEQRGAPPPALRGNVMDLAILNEVEYGAEYG